MKKGRESAFFRRAAHVDTAKMKPVKKIDTGPLLRPLKEEAKRKAKELGVSPGLLFNALYYCLNDPDCDVDALYEEVKKGGDDYLRRFLLERGVEI